MNVTFNSLGCIFRNLFNINETDRWLHYEIVFVVSVKYKMTILFQIGFLLKDLFFAHWRVLSKMLTSMHNFCIAWDVCSNHIKIRKCYLSSIIIDLMVVLQRWPPHWTVVSRKIIQINTRKMEMCFGAMIKLPLRYTTTVNLRNQLYNVTVFPPERFQPFWDLLLSHPFRQSR